MKRLMLLLGILGLMVSGLMLPRPAQAATPDICTPNGWAPTRCLPVTPGVWTYTDSSGALGGVPVPGEYKNPAGIIAAVNTWMQGFVPGTYCIVNVGGLTGPTSPQYNSGVLIAQTYNYTVVPRTTLCALG
jgi:hypothetical protein